MAEAPAPLLRQRDPRPLAPLVQPHPAGSYDGANAAPTPQYDVFISHAGEDKDEIVRPLAGALRAAGLEVWYDEFTLQIGDSLRRNIDAGFRQSRFGVVVLSPSFFEKNWPQYELDGLVTLELSGQQRILPLWHRITKDEVIAHSPPLADKLARSTSQYTVEQIAGEIADVIRNRHG